MSETTIKPWQLLVLARLFAGGTKGATPAQLRTALKPWLDEPRAAEQDRFIAARVEALTLRGWCEAQGEGRSRAWRCTPDGERVAKANLGLGDAQAPPAWSKLVNGPLMAVALDVYPKSEAERNLIASAPGLRAAVLRRTHRLPVREVPTAKQATDALLWKQLGVESSAAFGMEAVKRHLLGQAVGHQGSERPSSTLLAQMASQAAGARRNDLKAMRESLLQQWLREASPDAAPDAAPSPPPALSLSDFAERVREAAGTTPGGWFGETLVFISHVFATYQSRFPQDPLSIDGFKERLVVAHRNGDVELVRADLVSAMNPDDVARSATHYLNGTFHFIRSERGGTARV